MYNKNNVLFFYVPGSINSPIRVHWIMGICLLVCKLSAVYKKNEDSSTLEWHLLFNCQHTEEF